MDIVLGTRRFSDFDLQIDRVVKGNVLDRLLLVRNYRPLSPAEQELIPGGHGIINGVRLRLAYDGKFGNSFSNLRLIPIGLSPQLQRMLSATRAVAQHP